MVLLSLCIEGTKGAGKSSTVEKLTQKLRQEGVTVEVCAAFARANNYAQARGFAGAREMISASAEENRLEVDFIRSIMAQAYESARHTAESGAAPVVLIYDRGWLTLYPHLFGGRWRAENPGDAEIEKSWQWILATAPPTVFLQASYEVTSQRRSKPDVLGGLDTEEKLREDVEGRRAFAEEHKDKIVLSFDTGKVPQDEVVASIASYVMPRLKPVGLHL